MTDRANEAIFEPFADGVSRTIEAAPCAECAINHYEVKTEDDRFFAVCPACGRRGSAKGSLYEASMAWRRMFDRSARTMSRMVFIMALALCVVSGVIAVMGFGIG